jgi:two-component system nitrogen regulation response regulator GlnG/two-component system response regulator HydG
VSDTTTNVAMKATDPTEGVGEDVAFALVLVAAASQAHRVGEAILVDSAWGEDLRVFGRGVARADDDARRALLVRQRPDLLEYGQPLEDDYVSRKQLAIGRHESGVRVENQGRLPLRVGDDSVTRAVVKPGELLEIDRRLLFLCVRRPAIMPRLRERVAMPPFGEADDHGFVGESAAAWVHRERVAFAAGRQGHVLLLGPSGSGKELAARGIHEMSTRAGGRLVARNAATFPSGLIDAELFGNAPNYPNVGMAERPGLVGEADRGTLFLDEIAELPESLQTHLLRVLDQGGEYHRLGESKLRRSDVRVVAASNRPIEHLKPDLAARFPLRVRLAGLDERADDVPLLTRHLLRRTARDDATIGARFLGDWDGKSGEPRVSFDLARALVTAHWTTHVRELEAVLWTSLSTSRGDVAELTVEVKADLARRPPSSRRVDAPRSPAPPPPRAPAAEITAEALRASLARHGGVKDRVWRELGLSSRFALRRLLQKYGIGDDES